MDQQQTSSDVSPVTASFPNRGFLLLIGGFILIILVGIGSYYFGVKSEQKKTTVLPTPLPSVSSVASHIIDFEKLIPRSYLIRSYANGEHVVNTMDEWNKVFQDLSRGNTKLQDYNIGQTLETSTLIAIEESGRPLAGYSMAVSKVEDMGDYIQVTINQTTQCLQGAQSMKAGFPLETIKIAKTSKSIRFVKKQINIPCK